MTFFYFLDLHIFSAVFLAMLVVVVYADDTPIEPIPKVCPEQDPLNSTVHLAHETNCSLFYACQNGKKILLICPKLNIEGDRLYFNPLLQVCDWPENVECTGESEKDEEKEEEKEGEEEEIEEVEEEVEETDQIPDEALVRDRVVNRMLMNRF